MLPINTSHGIVTRVVPEYEFGTNTGRQGTFNPKNRQQRAMAISRFDELSRQYGDRLDFNYTGMTGLSPGDAKGYSDMLNARTEAANIERILGGGQPLNTKFGGVLPPPKGQAMPRPRYNPGLLPGHVKTGSPIAGDGFEVPTGAAPWSLGYGGSAVRGTSTLGRNRTMYGADAHADREAALAGFYGAQADRRESELDADPWTIQQQRKNILGHGTIEQPEDFKLRTRRELTAETMDPASPLGQRDELDYQRRLGEADLRYGLPARIRGDAQLRSADIGAQGRMGAAQITAGSRQADALSRNRSAALSALSDVLTGRLGYDLSPEQEAEFAELIEALEGELFGDEELDEEF